MPYTRQIRLQLLYHKRVLCPESIVECDRDTRGVNLVLLNTLLQESIAYVCDAQVRLQLLYGKLAFFQLNAQCLALTAMFSVFPLPLLRLLVEFQNLSHTELQLAFGIAPSERDGLVVGE